MQVAKNILITGVAIWAILIGYRYLSLRIYLKNSGVQVQGTVIEAEKHPGYCFVRFSYLFEKQKYLKSLRMNTEDVPAENSALALRILPESPDSPHLEFHNTALEEEIRWFFLLAAVYIFYRVVAFMIISTRPSFE
jgi:hypothetical protein